MITTRTIHVFLYVTIRITRVLSFVLFIFRADVFAKLKETPISFQVRTSVIFRYVNELNANHYIKGNPHTTGC